MQEKEKSSVVIVPEGEIKSPRSVFVGPILVAAIALAGLGLMNLYSAAYGTDFFWSQVKNYIPALIVFFLVGWVIPLRYFNDYALGIYGIVCLMLCVVFFTGHIAGGSQRWMGIGPVRVQPSEFAKVAVVLVVARFFHSTRFHTAYRLQDLWFLALLIGVIFGLIFEQPDLGTAGMCLLIALAQLAFIRIDMRSLAIVGGASLLVGVIGWNVFLHDYQKLRVVNLFNPEHDPTGSGYNSLQSLVAIGSGNLWGKGLLKGTQTQLQFLPARQTDFVFAVFAEEHGFFLSCIVFVLFGALTYMALGIARTSRDTFSGLVAVGIGALLFLSFVINIAMVLGMFPVVGMPLPMFSNGGSSLLTMGAGLGLLIAIDRQNFKRMTGQTRGD